MAYEQVPDELKQLPRWGLFHKEWVPARNRYTKIPIDPRTGKGGKSNDESTWSDFETAVTAMAANGNADGLAFYFKPPYIGIDIDHVQAEIEAYAEGNHDSIVGDFMDRTQSYAETSLSGEGVHIIVMGTMPGDRRRHDNVEIYPDGRFFALTGNAFGAHTSTVTEVAPADLQHLYTQYVEPPQPLKPVMESNNRPAMTLRQDQMLHFRLMPDARYRYLIGRSPLESLQDAITLDNEATKNNMDVMDKQINPAGKLTIDHYLAHGEDLESARDEFEKANSGENSGRLMVLPDGFSYDQIEMKTDVFKALAANSAYSADQISKAFGVPSDILGGGASTESQHSNIDMIKATYLANLNTYVNPIVDELRQKMNAPDLELDIKDMLDVDDSILIGQVNTLVTSGAITPEQGQYMLTRSGFLPSGLPAYEPVKGGDNNDNQD